jgi:hypothetical protein
VVAIAIDSTGLKQFGHDEWHQEKYKLSAKRSWRKLHIAVDTDRFIHACDLTNRFSAYCQSVETLAKQVDQKIGHVTDDGSYDKNPTYETLTNHFSNADVVISPDSDAVYNRSSHPQRNRNLQEIKKFGRIVWQRIRNYGRRNYYELAIFRYKKILGGRLHVTELSRQKKTRLCLAVVFLTG